MGNHSEERPVFDLLEYLACEERVPDKGQLLEEINEREVNNSRLVPPRRHQQRRS